MTNTSFPLIKNLILPATGNPNKGYLLFPAGQFSLSYDVVPKPKVSQLDIILTVVETSTKQTVWPLGIYEITTKGFKSDTPSNQAEYDAYITELQTRQAAVDASAITYQEAQEIVDLAEVPTQEQIDSRDAARLAHTANVDALESLEEVSLTYDYINKYEDVIQYFRGDGTLTDEGIAWAKQVTFLGEPLSNYID